MALGLAATLLGPVAPASAAPDHCEDLEAPLVEPVELCDLVALEGTQTGYIRVSAGEGFTFGGAAVRLEGSGTVGFVLTQDPPATGGFLAFRLKYPAELAGTSPNTAYGCIPACQLGPGHYRLYLITSGAPARATLDLGGQFEGAVNVPVAHFPAAETKLLSNRLPDLPGRPANSAGETRTMPSRGLIFSAIAAFHPNHVASQVGRCLYYGDPGDPAIAYLPGCPSPFADLVSIGTYPDATVSIGTYGTRVEGVTSVLPDTYGVGTWHVSVSTDTTAASLLVWLPYD